MRSAIVIVFALAGCVDRGECLMSHSEQQWYQPPPIYIQSGSAMIPVMQPGYYIDVQVCDQWQYPNGRPKQ